MVHCGIFFTLFLAVFAFAHDNHDGPHSSKPPATTSSPGPVVSYVTIFKTKTEFKYKTKTIDSCSPGYPKSGNPTLVVKPDDKPTSTPKPPPQSTQTLLSTSVGPPASPTSTSVPAPSKPQDDDEDCDDDDEEDDISSSLPLSSNVKPGPSSSYSTKPDITPPAALNALPSSSVVSPDPSSKIDNLSSYSSSIPVPSSSVISSPASSVIPSTGASQPTSTGKYDRNAICGKQKREPSPLEVVPQISKRDHRRRIAY